MIILYLGRRGAGKSLTMTKDAYQYYKDGWTVYSNIDLNFPHEFMSNEDILKIGDGDLENVILVIDEIQILVDSRRSPSKANLDFSHFIQQIRKRHIIILCTAQYGGTVDVRLRQHVDIIARPQYNKKFKVCAVRYIDVTVTDIDDLYQEPQSVEVVYNAIPLFELYNTDNIIRYKKKEKVTGS